MFEKLTKAQRAVINVLCTMQQRTMPAMDIKPATLGTLCAMALVDVVDGAVRATCIFQWNLAYHPEMYPSPTDTCLDNICELLTAGMRIGAVHALRTDTGMGLKNAISWMDHHYPK